MERKIVSRLSQLGLLDNATLGCERDGRGWMRRQNWIGVRTLRRTFLVLVGLYHYHSQTSSKRKKYKSRQSSSSDKTRKLFKRLAASLHTQHTWLTLFSLLLCVGHVTNMFRQVNPFYALSFPKLSRHIAQIFFGQNFSSGEKRKMHEIAFRALPIFSGATWKWQSEREKLEWKIGASSWLRSWMK